MAPVRYRDRSFSIFTFPLALSLSRTRRSPSPSHSSPSTRAIHRERRERPRNQLAILSRSRKIARERTDAMHFFFSHIFFFFSARVLLLRTRLVIQFPPPHHPVCIIHSSANTRHEYNTHTVYIILYYSVIAAVLYIIYCLLSHCYNIMCIAHLYRVVRELSRTTL